MHAAQRSPFPQRRVSSDYTTGQTREGEREREDSERTNPDMHIEGCSEGRVVKGTERTGTSRVAQSSLEGRPRARE